MMIIFWPVALSLDAYLKLIKAGKIGRAERPQLCGSCGGRDCYWAHGCYIRVVEEDGRSEELAIERFKCRICGKTVSLLPWFVVPGRRYSIKTLAAGVEGYATDRETYKEGATKLGEEGPSPAQLFCWVALIAKRVNELLLDVQGWCVMAEEPEETLLVCENATCPNADKAQIPEKAQLLDLLAKLVAYGGLLINDREAGKLHGLGMRFLENVEQMQQIFSGRSTWKQSPQRVKP